MIASLEAPEGSPMMTAFMPYLLLDDDAHGRFQVLIAAALFRPRAGEVDLLPPLITLDGHRTPGCTATVAPHPWGCKRVSGHRPALAQRLPGTGRLASEALLEQARQPTWRLWARDAGIEKKDLLNS